MKIKIFLKKWLLVLMVMIAVLTASVAVLGFAKGNKFELTAKDKLEKFFGIQGKSYYDYMPSDIINKHKATIEKVDEMIKKLPDGITTKDMNFSLNYYEQIIRVGIVPYIIDDKQFAKEVNNLLKDITNYTKKNKKKENGKERKPTVIGQAKESDMVYTSLNANNYNATKAKNYAKLWTKNGQVTRNSAYNYYDGMPDCTNFVSQCLHDSNAGGLPYVRIDHLGWDYDDLDNWYYANGFLDPPSYTWGAVENLYDHLDNYGINVRRLDYFSQCRVGDIIQWDLDEDSSVLEHSTIITKIESGTIYLTYHSTDKEDEPISTFLNSGYSGYAWAINH